jgi:hypothetical protein
MCFAASFIRAAVRQVTAGAFPTRSQDEWAIYQRDLAIARVFTKITAHASTEIRRLETNQICICHTETRAA